MASRRSLQAQLGKRIRKVRHDRDLSQMDLVRQADWSLSHYQKLERGVLDPRLSTLKKLADTFEISLSKLLEDV
jgi:transcriptional regulator with XRE-family HTH domain